MHYLHRKPNCWRILYSGIIVLLLCVALFPTRSMAQLSIRDSSISLFMPSLSYGFYVPGGDFAKRYGAANLIGIDFGYKHKSNFYVTGGAHFVFGENVLETDVFSNITTSQGFIINGYGEVEIPGISLRGIAIPIRFGKIISSWRIGKSNPNCGVYVELGAQYFQHKMRFQTGTDSIPQLRDEYQKGYDRLTAGFGIIESIGYRHFGSNRLLNFFIAVDLSQNFTINRRGFNFNTNSADNNSRLDLLFGLRVGWCIPIYSTSSNNDYYYY